MALDIDLEGKMRTLNKRMFLSFMIISFAIIFSISFTFRYFIEKSFKIQKYISIYNRTRNLKIKKKQVSKILRLFKEKNTMLTIILGIILSPIALISAICSLGITVGIIYCVIKGIAKTIKEIYKKENDENGK